MQYNSTLQDHYIQVTEYRSEKHVMEQVLGMWQIFGQQIELLNAKFDRHEIPQT